MNRRASTLCFVRERMPPGPAYQEGHRRLKSLVRRVGIVLLCGAVLPLCLQAQKSRKALTKNEVVELLESGVSPARVEELARQYGLAFSITPNVENELRDAGATDDLVSSLRSLPPKTSSSRPVTPEPPKGSTGPPILLIEATPGGAQVYVDDEPVGTTSPAGRLKLSQLSPGEHRVRLSHPGKRDFETSVTLTAGETTPLSASLEGAPAATNPLAAGQPEPAARPSAPASPGGATLGVRLAAQAPPGTRGAYISDVAPGGPAERAGLRSGYSILSIEGRSVNSPQEAQRIVAQFLPGTKVDITYSDGRNVQTTGALLVARSSYAPPGQGTSPSASNPLGPPPAGPVSSFNVAHDHGQSGADYCVGTLTIGGGAIQYRSTTGVHAFAIPLGTIREARKNAVYLAALGAFHIRLKKGANYNFVVLNSLGQHQPPDGLLLAIEQAMGRQ